MIPRKLPSVTFVEGNRWAGIPAISILYKLEGSDSPPAPPEFELQSVTMRFKRGGTNDIVELSSEDPTQIEIVSAVNWEVSVPEQIVPLLVAGRWDWQMTFRSVETDGNPQTYLCGDVTVTEKI